MSTKFVITKGVDNIYTFTIKEEGLTTPMSIDPSDTFIASLVDLETESTVLTKPLTVENSQGGKIVLSILENEANQLIGDRGAEVDRYYLKPTYKIILECNTVVNGDFIAKILEVFIDG